MNSNRTRSALAALSMLLAVPATGWAQNAEMEAERDQHLTRSHSVLQKTGIGTIAVTGALGLALAFNKPTIFGEGLCEEGTPAFGEFGCNGGLSLLHFAFAGTSIALFVTSEILATQMAVSPYETNDTFKYQTMKTLLWLNVALFANQAVLGVIAAHPQLIGIPKEARRTFSKVLRTIHMGFGVGVASTYTLHAAIQW